MSEVWEAQHAQDEQRIEQLKGQVKAAMNDLDTIAAALLEEAESRDWCDEYDTFVRKLNRKLTFQPFSVPQKTYYAQYRVWVTVDIPFDAPRGFDDWTEWHEFDKDDFSRQAIIDALNSGASFHVDTNEPYDIHD